jgi:hypothetical protein
MPLCLLRPTLAGLLIAAVVLLAVGARPASAVDPQELSSNPMVTTALQYEGTYQGECWAFVRKVVLEATGRQMGFDYREGFFEAGAVEVSLENAGPGDVVQIARDADTSPFADYPGLHTAIIVTPLGDGTFDAIDSNQNFDGMVRFRPRYDPAATAAAVGLQYHIYRFTGDVPREVGAPPGSATDLSEGDRAVVQADGDGLNLRSAPGLSGARLALLPDGTEVTVTGAATFVGGRWWVPVVTPAGSGWVAADYLVRTSAAPAGTDAPSRPLSMPFRSVSPFLVMD